MDWEMGVALFVVSVVVDMCLVEAIFQLSHCQLSFSQQTKGPSSPSMDYSTRIPAVPWGYPSAPLTSPSIFDPAPSLLAVSALHYRAHKFNKTITLLNNIQVSIRSSKERLAQLTLSH